MLRGILIGIGAGIGFMATIFLALILLSYQAANEWRELASELEKAFTEEAPPTVVYNAEPVAVEPMPVAYGVSDRQGPREARDRLASCTESRPDWVSQQIAAEACANDPSPPYWAKQQASVAVVSPTAAGATAPMPISSGDVLNRLCGAYFEEGSQERSACLAKSIMQPTVTCLSRQ